ncbi:hypothetical protein [Nocardia sp. NRRL S-836]|uniref:hypothetical protein n=1 Tax=Nocardia sp. NRRL S-836 TaxID=1519492 RepID=UPI0012F7EA52|nr:hypothetical protein [Nocardia sp. NRRL S-836]
MSAPWFPPAQVSGQTNIQRLPQPGQAVMPALSKQLLSQAPWIFVVYMAFQAMWTPEQVTKLLVVIIPLAIVNMIAKA